MMYSNKKALYWVWLAGIFKPASRRAVKLLRVFDNAENVFRAQGADLTATGVLSVKDRIYTDIMRHDLSQAREIIRWCDRNKVRILTPDMPDYPANLTHLMDAPLALYVVGELPDFSKHLSLSVVGTRKMTEYGRKQAFRMGYALARSGAVVVSGIALGVDGLAMASAIEGGGTVVGVIGSGIDIVYPADHKRLFRECISHGAIITEYAPGTRPTRSSFPQRNRLISALSQGTIVVEGDVLSGALITARHALYQGKDVFAVPGSVDSEQSSGPNALIREGVFAVTSARDALERYEFVYPHTLVPSLATLCLCGVDVKRSAELTSQKYGTHGTLNEAKRSIYGEKYTSSDPSRVNSVVMLNEPVREEYIPKNIPKAPLESSAGKNKPARRSKKEPLFAKSDAKSQPKVQRIDFEMLTETDKKVYAAMTADTPMLPDEIIVEGLGAKDIMASLTMLEISGAVEAGAAGYFMKSGTDEYFDAEV